MTRRIFGAASAALGMAVMMTALLWSGVAWAAHDAGKQCYDCHDLSGANVEPGTHLVSRGVMTESKSHGWTIGKRLGCTFCHRSVNATAAMPDALTGLTGTTPGSSRHPVARNFATGAVDNTAYLSNDNTATADHLDCRDCHDTALVSYPNHSANWINNVGAAGQTKATNPYGLKNVSGLKAYDDLCRACHRSGAAFTAFTGKAINTGVATKLVLASHDNAVDNTVNAIKDLDNTILRPQNQYAAKRTCSMCHDGHNSTTSHLFNDGHEKDWTGAPEPAIDENTDCTTVCHMRGDAVNGYDAHGHGKAADWNGTPMNRACTACHDISKPHAPGSAVYEIKYRFPSLDNSWKTPSAFGKPVKSICGQCHGTKSLHATAKGSVGCIDCHDQHAKNSDNNVMMIRSTNRVAGTAVGVVSGVGSTIGSEPVLFQKSQKYPNGPNYDYFSSTSYQGDTSAGFCDQRACHGAGATTGTPYIPMSTYMSSGKHAGGNQAPGSNCESCHAHVDPAGSFRASSSCTSCHGQPPPPADNTSGTVYPRTETLSPHPLHAGPASGTGYGFGCRTCHSNYTDSSTHNTATKSFQSVFFDNAYKRGVSAYDNATFTCTNITCHSDGRGNVPRIAPTWFTGGGGQVTLTCVDCHLGSSVSGFPIVSGAHTKHLNSGYGCSTCHVDTVADDNVTLNASTGKANHVNFIRNVSIKGAYDNDATSTNNWDNVAGTCSGIKCHGGSTVNWTTDIGKVSCANCHVRTGDVDDFGNGSAASINGNSVTAGIDNTEWMYSGHGRDTGSYDCTANVAPNLVGSSTGKNKCKFCHDGTVAHGVAANPFRLANTNWNGMGINGNCYVCHEKGSAAGYQPPQDNASLTYSLKTSASFVDNNHYNLGNAVNARHSATYNGGQFCWDCHDPHGDRSNATTGNIIMIGKKVNASTEGVLGIPTGGTAGAGRRDAVFTKNVTGADYATGGGAYTGICETCHIAASGITHYYNTGVGTAHSSSKCTTCHSHDGGFKGMGGPDVGQYFDRKIMPSGNYADNSSHPLRGLTENSAALLFGGAGSTNCLGCHYGSGAARTSDECLKCHYENNGGTAALGTNHMDKLIQLAAITPGTNTYGTAAFPIASITDYDNWCLQCHNAVSATSLGGIAVTSKAVTPTAAFNNGRHRNNLTQAIGCIYCHQPHGRGNAKLIRENADNRRTAGGTPMRFGVFPNDNLSLGGYGAAQNQNFRARQYWADNSLPYLPEADDDQSYCNKTCHPAKLSNSLNKDRMVKRDGTTGNYLPNGAPLYRKVFIVGGVEYTTDNTVATHHQHPNGEIIPTDSMINWYASLTGSTGPSFYQYPLTTSSLPSAYNPATSDLPFSPDYLGDGVREFTNAYNGLGVRITYRLTCSTCHNPHGTTLANAPGDDGFPDLRLPRANPSTLCLRCHK
jgi:predicted CxxxxCH...CXXCH cytochrome family protein